MDIMNDYRTYKISAILTDEDCTNFPIVFDCTLTSLVILQSSSPFLSTRVVHLRSELPLITWAVGFCVQRDVKAMKALKGSGYFFSSEPVGSVSR